MYKTVDLERDLFGSSARARILELLTLNPRDRFYLRQMSSRLGLAVGSVQQEMPRLQRAGIAVREQDGNRVYYRADPESPVYPELRGLFLKFGGVARLLRDLLRKHEKSIRWAFIFGSVAKGNEEAWSDVDLCLVGGPPDLALEGFDWRAQKLCGREVNSVHYEEEELRRKVRAGDHFVTSVLRGPRILLLGDEHGLAQIARERPVVRRADKAEGDRAIDPFSGPLPAQRPSSGPGIPRPLRPPPRRRS